MFLSCCYVKANVKRRSTAQSVAACAVFLSLTAAVPARAIMDGAGHDIFPITAIFNSSVTVMYLNDVNAGLTVSSGVYISNGAGGEGAALNVVGSFNLSTLSGTGSITAGISGRGANYIQNAEANWRNSYIIQRAGTQIGAIGTDSSPSTKLQLFTGATAVDGTARLTIDSSGNIGIGTASPDRLLDVSGGAVIRSSMVVTGAGLSGTSPVFQVIGGTMTVQYSGNVGLGTTGPLSALHIQAPRTQAYAVIIATGAATTQYLVTVATNGNVAIGTDVATSTLTVRGTFKLVDGTQSSGRVLTSDAAGLASWKTGLSGMGVSNAGVCTVTSVNPTNSEKTFTCSGVPASTAVAVTCSGSTALQSADMAIY